MTEPSQRAKYLRRYNAKYPLRVLLDSARYRAKKHGLPFDLRIDDIVVPEVCPALGIALRRNTDGAGPSDASPSIDRLSPALGYVRGNVRVISHRANMIKSNATADELEAVARYVRQAVLETSIDG